MQGLIFKEFIANKKTLKNILLFYGALLLIFLFRVIFSTIMPGITGVQQTMFENEQEYITFSLASGLYIMFCPFCIEEHFKYDERKAWASFIISAPPAEKGHIGAKYYYQLIVLIFALFISFICDMIFGAVTGYEFSVLYLNVNMFYGLLMLSALQTPFTVRFGTKSAGSIRAAVVLLILAAAGIYGLFGDLTIFNKGRLLDEIVAIANGESDSKVLMALAALAPFVSVAAYYYSYKISCSLYKKGVDTYDR